MISDHQLSSLFAISASTCFGLASVFFAVFSRRLGPLWLNAFKAALATFCFVLLSLALGHFHLFELNDSNLLFFASGFIGLGIGDLFLLSAYATIGAGRTLILFTFQPIIFLFVDSMIFGHVIAPKQFLSIFIFIICLLLFSFEKKSTSRKFQLTGLAFALIGMALDGVGIFITKKGFMAMPVPSSEFANTVRGLGACFFYVLLSFRQPIKFTERFFSLTKKDRWLISTCCFFGTFLSLVLYLNALRLGNLSNVTAITITGPVLTSIFENVLDKTRPSKTLLFCLLLLILAFILNFMVGRP